MSRWRCKRCRNLLDGNPLRCPSCGYTIYTPEPDQPTEAAASETARTFCPACGHLDATHGTKRKMCLACERPLNGPPGEPCPLTINGAIRFDCAGCDAVAHDLGGDETLGWVWDDDGAEVFCPACVANPAPSPVPSQSVAAEVEALAALLGDIRVAEARTAVWWTSDEDHHLLAHVLRAECAEWAPGVLAAGYLSPEQVAQERREAARTALDALTDEFRKGAWLDLGMSQKVAADVVAWLRDRAEGASDAE